MRLNCDGGNRSATRILNIPSSLFADVGRTDEELRRQRSRGCWLCRLSGGVHWQVQDRPAAHVVQTAGRLPGTTSSKYPGFTDQVDHTLITLVISKCYGKVRPLFFRATTLSFQPASRVVQAFVV